MKQIIAGMILLLAFGIAAFAQTNENVCPKINLIEPQSVIAIGETAQFSIEASKEIEKFKIEYQWTTSVGKILQGQGTPEITIATAETDAGLNIIATVKLIGLPENCANSLSGTVPIKDREPHPWFDTFGRLPKHEMYGRLDNFFVALRNNPTSEGLIILEFNKKRNNSDKLRRFNEIFKHIKFRKFDKTQLSFLSVESDDEFTRMCIVPPEAKITQVISESEVKNIIKGEELEQKIKELFVRK